MFLAVNSSGTLAPMVADDLQYLVATAILVDRRQVITIRACEVSQ